jgi:hypothetical protein
MKFHYSLEHANKVLALVQKEVRGVKSVNGDHVRIEAWANGREQGYCIKAIAEADGTDVAICFAQARSSDSLVVIAGSDREFNGQTNQPSETVWEKNRRHFDDNKKAAEYIAQEILKTVEPVAVKMMEGA